MLKQIPAELQEHMPSQELVDSHSAAYPKALGITWDSKHDLMSTHVQLPNHYVSTKRGIVSDTARSFDVLGWIAPVILQMKVLFQKLWQVKLGWDEELPEELRLLHEHWREELPLLQDIQLPRAYFLNKPTITVQLHGFCDASSVAYAAVIYIRATYKGGGTTCRLVVAKTRVAPLKQLTIPKLELCGAAMLAELLAITGETLSIPADHIHAWCDSTVALAWLKSSPSRFKVFVANRVAAASRCIPPAVWLHVATLENPADCASRGMSAGELKYHNLWWGGPPWLQQEPVEVPPQPQASELAVHQDLEAKPLAVYVSTITSISWWEHKFNSYTTLLHATAYILRFNHNMRAVIKGQPTIRGRKLTIKEVKAAEVFLRKQSQARNFPAELERLSADPPLSISPSSRLLMFHPFLGTDGLLHVGGRLSKSSLSPLQRHPIILSSSDYVTKLLFQYYHVLLLHCGPTLLLAHTGEHCCIVGAKKLARTVCQSCLVCRRAAPKPQSQLMGQLPAPRVNRSLAFYHAGVDYAGPFLLKSGNPRRPTIVKGYMALFVCLATKSLHLEVVSSLSTGAFIAGLKRFVSRKGLPAHIYSDNGSNFVGARNELKELYNFLSLPSTDAELSHFLLSKKVTWHHIPERAPHFGGIWESAVRSVKHHLRRTVGSLKLTFEEFTTVAAQIEACLNSRPYLANDSHDPDGEVPLTSGHFLIGRPMQAFPEEPVDPDLTLQNRWELCKALVQLFWDTWSKDYLQSLQRSKKWHKQSPNLKPGDLVMVLEETTLQTRWKLAKVMNTFPGKDGLVRTAEVMTKTTVFPSYYATTNRKLDLKDLIVKTSLLKRPVTKLALLMAASPTTLS